MNAKYMINVAEARGLFGGNAPPQKRPQQTKKKVENEEKTRQTKRKLTKHEVNLYFYHIEHYTNFKFIFPFNTLFILPKQRTPYEVLKKETIQNLI